MSVAQGWFADVDPDDKNPEHGYKWQPCLQLDGGICHSFEVWFKTEEECLSYIAVHIIGQGFTPDTKEGK